jgi:V8-like Glu-specific endopeptidase
LHYASTEKGSSGSPIISRDNLSVIGMHCGGSNINYGFLLKDILSYIKYIYDNIFKLKQNLIKDIPDIKYEKYDNDSIKVKKK